MQPKLSHVIDELIDNQLSGLHVVMPGKIVSYEADYQRASVKPLLAKRYKDSSTLKLPIITQVPIVFPRGGNAALTLPIATGDTVLLLFSERSLDEWLTHGQEVAPQDPRKHHLSDAIAIPGLCSFHQAINTDKDKIALQYNDAKLTIDSQGKFVMGNNKAELLELLSDTLQGLINALVDGKPLSTRQQFVQLQQTLDSQLRGQL